jgi:hypothetical protein
LLLKKMALFASGAEAVSVIVAATKTISNSHLLSTVQANVKVDNDGDLYKSTRTGGYGSSYETWLDAGLNTQAWVERTIISGTLTTDAGTGRRICSSDNIFGVSQAIVGTKTCVIDLKWYDAASGGSLLDTQRATCTATKLAP